MLAARLEAATPTLLESESDDNFEREAISAVTGYLGLPPTADRP